MEEDEQLKSQEAGTEAEEQQVGLRDEFIQEIAGLLAADDADRVQELCRELPAADAGELIVKLDSDRRHKLVEMLENELNPETFSYLDREILNDLLEHMSARHIASIVNRLDSDDAIHLIAHLDEERRGDIMRHLNRNLRAAVEEGLTYPEGSAGRLMQREFVAIPQFWTVGKTVDYLRAVASTMPEKFYNIFIVDPMHRFVGAVALSNVLCAQRSVKIDTLVGEEHITVPVTMDQGQAALLFSRKDLLSAPVIDEDERLIGVLTVDDIVDVIHAEAEKDFLNISGVSDSDIHSSVIATANSRFFWLAINLLTAIAASIVISFFEDTIAKIAVLAVLMPIVASMGGNAGTQTLAVAVRALATKDLSSANSLRVIQKEVIVALIDGILFALIMGTVVFLWFHNPQLGMIIGAAMVMNLIAAGFSGALIPIIMERMGHDPAQSAVVFLTTVTDIVGFFSFLGLASWLMV
ncbi:MAG: magnesium transporter [Alphaproteobacteria bacterium]|nr:magnesium transporter [Alphaproteobacteria bacterium]